MRDALSRVVANSGFQASERRREFLRFIVETTLSGKADTLKGYTVAVSVFGRDETFDAQTDPVVRLEARRLRRDLDSYYVDAGRRDPVRITIPKGSYVPHFVWNETAIAAAPAPTPAVPEANRPSPNVPAEELGAAPRPARNRIAYRWMLPGGIVALVAIAVTAWFVMTRTEPQPSGGSSGPTVVIHPLEPLSPDPEAHYLASGLTSELIDSLMQFPGFRLYTLPSPAGGGRDEEPLNLARERGVAYILEGNVTTGSDDARLAARLTDAATGAVLWSRSYDVPLAPRSLVKARRDLASEIAVALGQPYGVVNTDLSHRQEALNVSDMQSYLCVLRAYDYRRGFASEKFEPVLGCLEQAVEHDADYADAWAMLGWLYLDDGRFGFSGNADPEAAYEKALAAASRATTLEPDNPLALKALSSINYYMKRFDEAERLARAAVRNNPHDPDTLAQLGWRLAARGNFEDGIPILRNAIDRTANPPSWYFHFIAIDLYLKGEYQQILDLADRLTADGSGFSHAMLAVASYELGDRESAREAIARMSENKFLAGDPAAFMRRHGAIEPTIATVVAGIEKAKSFVVAENP